MNIDEPQSVNEGQSWCRALDLEILVVLVARVGSSSLPSVPYQGSERVENEMWKTHSV